MISVTSDDNTVLRQRVASLLPRLVRYIQNAWVSLDDGKGYFGDGSSGENGIRTNASLAFAISILLRASADCRLSNADREFLEKHLNGVVRYLVDGHRAHQGRCANGKPWGLVWQSSWWATKLALSVSENDDLFDDIIRNKLSAIVVAEVQHLVKMPIPTGLFHDTKAEETAWDAEILAFAVSRYPEHPDAAMWREELILRLVNTFSCASDRKSEVLIDGAPLCQRVRSCNVHDDGLLENHGCVHFCYVASPLLSKAWCHYCLLKSDWKPESLTHNTAKVWEVAKSWFLGNRFAYIGGQDWARYTYGEYFILPALSFLGQNNIGSDGTHLLDRRLRLIEIEASRSTDGSFYGARFTQGNYSGQWSKYEADTFACLALLYELLARPPSTSPNELVGSLRPTRLSYETQTATHRAQRFFFSFSWRTLQADAPNLSMIPMADDSLAEWHSGNLLGEVRMSSDQRLVGVKSYEEHGGQLRISGSHLVIGPKGRRLMQSNVEIELVSEQEYAIVTSSYRSLVASAMARVHGIKWRVPNDVFNNFNREVRYGVGDFGSSSSFLISMPEDVLGKSHASFGDRLRRRAGVEGTVKSLRGARWINIDGKIGLVLLSPGALQLRRFRRRISDWGSLYVDQIETETSGPRFWVKPGEDLLDTRVLIHIGDGRRTSELASNFAT